MKTYVVGNLKGGVGKTTSVVNLAYSLSVLGQNILVVDADPQANTTPFFTKIGKGIHTIRDLYAEPAEIAKMIYRSRFKGIDIIKGSTLLKESDVLGEMTLSESLCLVSDAYDICIIDTRPAFEAITRSALYAADMLLTPVVLDRFCRDNLLLVEDELDELGLETLEWKIFANKVENKRSQRNTYIDMVQKHSWSFCDTCISRGAVVDNALEWYKPLLKHRSKSRVTLDYLELAKELLEVGTWRG